MKNRIGEFLTYALVGALGGSGVLLGQPAALPDWWTNPGTAIIDQNTTENNYAPINLGQLKHVAAMAREHLDIEMAVYGGAGAVISALVDGFDASTPANFAPVNLGQLKAVAKPFYDRLFSLGYDTKGRLIDFGYPPNWPHLFPWDPSTLVEVNYAPANLGQLKAVFCFDLEGHDPALAADSDGNGLFDVWELAYFGATGVDPYGDPDGNGYPNIYEMYGGTNPLDPQSRPIANYIVDRTQPSDPGNGRFISIKSAVEQAIIDGFDYRIIEIRPGYYSGIENDKFLIDQVKMLIIAPAGPTETKILSGIDPPGSRGPDTTVHHPDMRVIRVLSESVISGLGFHVLDPPTGGYALKSGFIRFEGAKYSMIDNCTFSGFYDFIDFAVYTKSSILAIRNSHFSGIWGVSVRVDGPFSNPADEVLMVVDSSFSGISSPIDFREGASISFERVDFREMNYGAVSLQTANGIDYPSASFESCNFIGNEGPYGIVNLWSGTDAVFNNCTFVANRSKSAVYINYATAALNRCLFRGNKTSNWDYGAAVNITGGSTEFKNIRFEYNTSNSGGAVAVNGGTHRFENNIFLQNNALAYGGALYLSSWAGVISLVNCTIVGNFANEGSGVFLGGGALEIINSILWNDDSAMEIEGYTSGLVTTSSNIRVIDPQLRHDGMLRSVWNETTQSWDASPMRDLGSAALAPSHDFHGEVRPASGTVDLGADQWQDSVGFNGNTNHLPDWWEERFFGTLGQDPDGDPDDDGLANIWEYYYGTDPTNPDTDGDGLTDGGEIYGYGTDPLIRDSHLANLDLNGDGVPDGLGLLIGIDPYNYDHDGDGISNADELAAGTDPWDSLDYPVHQQPPHDPNSPPSITLDLPVNAVRLP